MQDITIGYQTKWFITCTRNDVSFTFIDLDVDLQRSSSCFLKENLKVSRDGVAKFIARFIETGSLSRKPGSGRPSSITQQMQAIVEAKMREDDETTAYQLRSLLLSQGFNISERTVLRCRTQLGWTFRGSAYCQLIRHANKVKRLEWARQYLHNSFDDVVWTDECSVQLESHKRFCCRKQGEPPRLKPRYNLHRIYIYA